MKKVAYIFAFAFLLLVGNTASAAPFNPPGDCLTVAVGNNTTDQGMPTSISPGGSGCGWFSTSVSASGGQVVHVHMYYHNASSANATNTRVSLTQSPTGSSTNFSFAGTISSDQGSSFGNASISISGGSQTLSLTEVEWFPNQTGSKGIPTPLPSGQSGFSILNGGVDIGTIAPGWKSQGEFTLTFLVGNTVTTTCAVTITASPSTITAGQTANLYWTATGTNSVIIDSQTYYGTSGTVPVSPSSTRAYTITPNCTSGSGASQSVTVNVTPVATVCRVDRFEPSIYNVTYAGQRVDLYWDTVGVNYVVVDGTTDNRSSGSKSVNPTRDTTYRLTAYCTDGTQIVRDRTVTFNPTNTYDDLTLNTNPATNITENSATLNGFIDANGNNATRWFRYGLTAGSMNMTTNIRNHGTGASNVSETVTNLVPNTTYYFQVVASDVQGTHYEANIRQFHTNASFITPSGSTSVVTTIATGVSQTGAQLNGLLLNTTSYATSTYFEYGTTTAMGSRTASKQMGLGTSIQLSDYVTGLAPNTIYYFRANAENANGRVFGSIQTFRTLGNTVVVPPTVITRVGTASPIMLKVENRYQCFNNGNTVDYTVTYQNIGSTTLTNPLLQVVLPVHVAFANTSRGTYAPSTHTVSIPLENLAPNKGGVIYVQGQVISLPVNNSEIVTTALLAYTNANGAQENAMAYVLNNQCFGNTLGASAFFAGGFWPTTLCGWLLLIIILILIALLIRWLLDRRDERNRIRYTTTTTRTTDHL